MSLVISNNANKLDSIVNEFKQDNLSLIQTSPNSMFLSILHIVWIWLRPTLPEPLSYLSKSKKSHGILKLVQLIKKQEELHMRFYHNYSLVVSKAENYADHVNTYINPSPIYKYNFYHYMNEAKCYKKMSENEKHKHAILKIKKDFIVIVLGSLLECCCGVQDNIL